MPETVPWGLAAVVGAVLAIAVAIRYPRTRRWIAALVVLVVFGAAALMALVIGALSRMDVGGELPFAAAALAIGFAVVGLLVAGVIIFARRRERLG
ncbi:MAG TPA: hypothetical protein VFL75_08765 [Candidatus Limnocylindria bacterium]|jgi:hypothetical protein|nr:hypothetical protein [Candidatus Limnocylindria bacterium]